MSLSFRIGLRAPADRSPDYGSSFDQSLPASSGYLFSEVERTWVGSLYSATLVFLSILLLVFVSASLRSGSTYPQIAARYRGPWACTLAGSPPAGLARCPSVASGPNLGQCRGQTSCAEIACPWMRLTARPIRNRRCTACCCAAWGCGRGARSCTAGRLTLHPPSCGRSKTS